MSKKPKQPPDTVDQLAAIKQARAKVRDQRIVVHDRTEMLKAARTTLADLELQVEDLIDEDLPLFSRTQNPEPRTPNPEP